MKRDLQGHTVPIVIEGEELQAFVPNPLPPDPPIRPTADLTNISDSALIAMRLLNGVLSALEDHASIAKLLSYLEAVLSCQIDDLPSNVVSMFNARMGCPIANSSIETQEALCYTLAQKEGFEHLEKGGDDRCELHSHGEIPFDAGSENHSRNGVFRGRSNFCVLWDNGFHRRSISPWPQKKSRLRGPRNLTVAEEAIANEVSQMIHTGDYSAESGQSLLQRLLKHCKAFWKVKLKPIWKRFQTMCEKSCKTLWMRLMRILCLCP